MSQTVELLNCWIKVLIFLYLFICLSLLYYKNYWTDLGGVFDIIGYKKLPLINIMYYCISTPAILFSIHIFKTHISLFVYTLLCLYQRTQFRQWCSSSSLLHHGVLRHQDIPQPGGRSEPGGSVSALRCPRSLWRRLPLLQHAGDWRSLLGTDRTGLQAKKVIIHDTITYLKPFSDIIARLSM